MSSFIFHAKAALLGEELEYKENVYIKIDEGYINEISEKPFDGNDNVISLSDSLLIPSFINMHVHVGDSFAKERGSQLTLSEVVEPPHGLKHVLLEKTDTKTISEGIQNSIKEMLSSGTTFFLDFREGGIEGVELLLEASTDLKIKKFILGRPGNKDEDIFKLMKLSHGLGLSSVNDYSDDELQRFNLLYNEGSKILSTHVSEVEYEREKCLENYNCTDIERAINVLGANLLVHGIHASDQDIELIKENDVTLVCCTRANSYFSLSLAPLDKFIKKGINLCLGTDNVMANSPDLLREMEFFAKRVRGEHGPKLISSKEILKMITINAAHAINLDHDLGSIDPLKKADFLVIDINAPNLQGLTKENVHDFIVYRLKSENITQTYINGNIVFKR